MSNESLTPTQPQNTQKIAFVIDGVVVEVLATDERLAAMFLSQPEIIDVSMLTAQPGQLIGYTYDKESGTLQAPVLHIANP
jgi:hypothetical protein